MKRRLGYTLLVMLTVVLLKLISIGLGWVNLPSDFAVGGGFALIGTIVVLSPKLYTKVWKSMIASKPTPITINLTKEKKNEEV